MNAVSTWMRAPNLAVALVVLALVVLVLVVEHVYEWPFPLRRNAR